MGLLDFLKEAACDVGIHSWGDWFYPQSDCTQVRQCVRPQCRKINDMKRTLHSFGEWGYPEGASCRNIRTCSRCGYVEERTLHPWKEWEYPKKDECLQVRKCSRCADAETQIKHLPVWSYDGPKSCNQVSVCARCGHKEPREAKKSEDHAGWSEWGYDPGLRSCSAQARYCLRCGEEETRVVIARHDYSSGWVQVSSTRRERRCAHCGRVETETLRPDQR